MGMLGDGACMQAWRSAKFIDIAFREPASDLLLVLSACIEMRWGPHENLHSSD